MNQHAKSNKDTSRAPTDVRQQQYLTFAVGAETFAVGILEVREIIRFGTLTEVPTMPSHLRGVMNLRGAVLPVVDLRARFGQGNATIVKRTCIVIVELMDDGDSLEIGILVDAVCAVVRMEDHDIEPPPPFGTGVKPDLIRGMVQRGERFVMLLDLRRVFSLDELAASAALAHNDSAMLLAA
jgi:purine-binding chemotaxis protein CheW